MLVILVSNKKHNNKYSTLILVTKIWLVSKGNTCWRIYCKSLLLKHCLASFKQSLWELKFFSIMKAENLTSISNTVFRQAFLLIQYSFICKQYFFLFRQRISIFFWQMLNKTADCFNNIVLFWSWKLVEKIDWKNGKQINVGKDLMCV